jgi:hypothetical protein
MNLGDLALAALQGNDLAARQWVKNAVRKGIDFSELPQPEGLDQNALAVAASLAELLAGRQGRPAPGWTSTVSPAAAPLFLLPQARHSAALRRWCEQDSPEPLRARNVFAVRDYLSVA